MKINVVAVGKIKEEYLRQGILEYSKRISRFARLEINEVAESKNKLRSENAICSAKKEEGQRILAKICGKTIALDSRGDIVTSNEIADILKLAKDEGQELTFIIGGSDGLDSDVVSKADKIISFGKVTYPHQLMRMILMEQIYRGFTINNNITYHK